VLALDGVSKRSAGSRRARARLELGRASGSASSARTAREDDAPALAIGALAPDAGTVAIGETVRVRDDRPACATTSIRRRA
jgi:hypothetical protein